MRNLKLVLKSLSSERGKTSPNFDFLIETVDRNALLISTISLM